MMCHDSCQCSCDDQGCGDQVCQDCHSACDNAGGPCEGQGGGPGDDMQGGDDGPPACVASQFDGMCDETTGDCDNLAMIALVCGTGGATLDTSACGEDEMNDIEGARSEMCTCATA